MAVTKVVRRGLVTAAVAAASLTMFAAAALPAAIAAPSGQARPAGVHTVGTVDLGPASVAADFSFGEAPNGAVYFAAGGSSIWVVNGTSAPEHVLTASGKVLAIAASSTDIFVTVRKTVTEYTTAGLQVRQWRLHGPATPTSGGLFVVGSRVWAWTDFATDESGFENANAYWFSTSSSVVHAVTSLADPFYLAADSAGLYYQSFTSAEANCCVVRVANSGHRTRAKDGNYAGPIALAGGKVTVLNSRYRHGKLRAYLVSFNGRSMRHVYTRAESANARDIAGGGGALLLLNCPTASCRHGTVRQLNTSTGAVTSSVSVPFAVALLSGPSGAVITYTGGSFWLTRLAG